MKYWSQSVKGNFSNMQPKEDITNRFSKIRESIKEHYENPDKENRPSIAEILKNKQEKEVIKEGTVVRWNKTVRRAKQDIENLPENNPVKKPELWENITTTEIKKRPNHSKRKFYEEGQINNEEPTE